MKSSSSCRALFIICLVFSFCWVELAFAAGFYLPGRGVQPMGRAGAVIVSGEGSLNSLWYNPANLSTLKDLTLTLDASIVDLYFYHHRAPRRMDNGDIRYYQPVEQEAWPEVIPQVLIGGATHVENLGWSFGFYTPYASSMTYPEHGPQRYVLVDSKGSLMGYLHLALGYQVTDWLRVGAGIQNYFAQSRVVSVNSGYVGFYGDPEDDDLDILTEITSSQLFNLTGNIGVWARLHRRLEAGASLQLPVTIHDTDAKVSVRMPSHPAYDNAYMTNDRLTLTMNMPLMARLGLRYVHNDRWDLEVATVFEQWSAFDTIEAIPNDITVEGIPGIGSMPLQSLSVPVGFQDTFSVHVGSDVRATDELTLRGGYAYETGAVPDENLNAYFFDSDKHVISLGVNYLFDSFDLDASFAYFIIPERVITNSRVRQINPVDVENKLTLIVGNGTYRARVLAFGLGLNYRF